MTEFLPQGRLDMFSVKHKVNTDSDTAEVAQTTRRLSRLEEINRIKSEEKLGVYTSCAGTEFVFLPPYGQYAPYDLMTMVCPRGLGEGFKTQEIYDLDPEDQIVYWKLQVEGLRHTEKLAGLYAKGEDVSVFSTQNCTCFLGDETRRSPRTMGLVHWRTLMLPKKHVTPKAREIIEENSGNATNYVWKHLWTEWGLLRSNSNRIKEGVDARIPPELAGKYELEVRHSPPIGYSVVVPIPEKDDSWNDFQRVMNANHNAFAEAASSAKLREVFKGGYPMPSYRQYAYLRDNFLVVPISPVIVSWSGPMEAAGVMFSRDDKYDQIVSEGETLAFQSDLTQTLLEEAKNF